MLQQGQALRDPSASELRQAGLVIPLTIVLELLVDDLVLFDKVGAGVVLLKAEVVDVKDATVVVLLDVVGLRFPFVKALTSAAARIVALEYDFVHATVTGAVTMFLVVPMLVMAGVVVVLKVELVRRGSRACDFVAGGKSRTVVLVPLLLHKP